ncbi:uncharacterized protein JCM15063_002355 [Sporobolomyces koalae]|uniref:uncharacterized protein n=1 Tax=Sporobolomyces koalae TaxID=500713 RepID=UPI003175D651
MAAGLHTPSTPPFESSPVRAPSDRDFPCALAVNATATATSLLSVPAYATATSQAAFATATAKALAHYLPGYTYNLTEESSSTRISICNQTTAFCATSGCSKMGANVTTNFCNPMTMGWNCECNDGADSRLQPLVVPVNTYDCRLRTAACLDQCSNPKASPPVTNEGECKNACNYILGSTCGTSNQVLPEYQVKSYNSKPKYYGDTSKGGYAYGISASSLSIAMPSALTLLMAVCGVSLLTLT